MIRLTLAMTGLLLATACSPDLNTPKSMNDEINAPLFAKGSNEQRLVDKLLARFPAERAEKLYRILATGESILTSQDPEIQADIDAVYAVINARNAGKPPRAEPHEPGPVEGALIAEFIASSPPDLRQKLRAALYSSNGRLQSDDPAARRKLEAIYDARDAEAEALFQARMEGKKD
jgi:hypothetical protein